MTTPLQGEGSDESEGIYMVLEDLGTEAAEAGYEVYDFSRALVKAMQKAQIRRLEPTADAILLTVPRLRDLAWQTKTSDQGSARLNLRIFIPDGHIVWLDLRMNGPLHFDLSIRGRNDCPRFDLMGAESGEIVTAAKTYFERPDVLTFLQQYESAQPTRYNTYVTYVDPTGRRHVG